MASLLLSSDWDLSVDAAGNIATVDGPSATAQDVACACRTFLGECVFDTTLGVPYLTQVMGGPWNYSLLSALFSREALKIQDVVAAQTTFTGPASDRRLTGTVAVIDTTGQALNASF